MTIKQAALLAAVGTTLRLCTYIISYFRSLMTPGIWHSPGTVLYALLIISLGMILSAALPVFFACVYLNEPALVVPERLRRPALVAAIAAGLSAAIAAFHQIRDFISSWNMADIPLMRADRPLLWLWEWPFRVLISLLAAIAVPLFFFTVARSRAELQSVSPRLKKAALYAGFVTIVGAAFTIYQDIHSEIFMWTHQALLAAAPGRAQIAGPWYRIPATALGLFHSGSLAWFFFLFYRTVPTAQSSQRLSSGE
jgi:hypothetical protein